MRRRTRTPSPRGGSARPRLESLEDRTAPALVGGLDPSFGTNGVTAVVPGHPFVGVAVQQDAKLVAVSSSGPDFYITRYNPDGTIDTTFGSAGTGVVTVDIGGAGKADNARAVAIDSQDRIVVVGSGGAAVADFALVRLSPDGKAVQLNTHFHDGDPAAPDFTSSVAFQSDGTIVIAGSEKVLTNLDFAVARLDQATGNLIGAVQITSLGSPNDAFANAVAVYQSGPNVNKIVAVGNVTFPGPNPEIGVTQ